MKKVLASVWVLALLIAVPLIIFLPPLFDKFNVDLQFTNYQNRNAFFIYHVDLNSDGKKEKVKSYNHTWQRLNVQYFEESGIAPVDQLNFPYSFHNQFREVYFGDVDDDGYKEIYGFTKSADSLYLSWFEPYPGLNSEPESKFICKMYDFREGKFDVYITNIHFKDLNSDGTDEIVIPVSSGFSLKPRNIFVFDLKNDTVRKTEYNGINPFDLKFADLNDDNKPEIIVDNVAAGNLKDSFGNLHIDNIVWLQVFNADLTPYTEPVPFTTGLVNRIHNFAVGEKKNRILTFHFDENSPGKSVVYLFDNKCEKRDSLILPKQSALDRHSVFRYDDNQFLVVEGKFLTWLTSNLQIIKTKTLELPSMAQPIGLFNILSQKKQLVFLNYDRKKLFIFTENFKHKTELEFEKEIKYFTKWNASGDNQFYVLTNDAELQYRISGNNFYYLKYPVYLAIYFISVLFIWLIQSVRTKQLRERYELQNQVRELQLISLRNQLDPHFIYNTFNSIASVIKQGRGDEAYDIFVLFSKMVRSNLDNSGEIFTSLKSEIDFISNYLLIQKFRFKDLFDYKIEKQRNIDLNLKIPRLLVQIHVENALKHGIRPKRTGGMLFIRLTHEQNRMRIEIEDNGIGRKKALQNANNGTGIGLKTINQIIELSSHRNKLKIDQEIIDLTDENGEPAGTKVVVLLSY